jgi:hypothetical protein
MEDPNYLYDGQLTADDIEQLIQISDPDGIYTMLEDEGLTEAADYIAEHYF